MNRPDRDRSQLESLLSSLEPPADMVDRVVERSLRPTEPATVGTWRRRLLLGAAVGLVLATSAWLTLLVTPSEGPFDRAVSPARRADYQLTNRDGLLVLSSANGEVLSISGESELQPMAGVN